MEGEHIDRVRAQFTRTAEVYARLAQTTDERGLAALVALSGAVADDRVLDVACGPGFLTMAFARQCARATGCDATDAFLALARAESGRRGLRNVRFEHGDATRLPYADAGFDVVACRAAFHHFPQPERVLAEMKRVARPGGRLLVADLLGSEDPEKAKLHDRVEQLCDPTHVRALPESELLRLFAAADLGVVRQVRSSLHYELDEWIAHGAPDEDARREIVARMESWLRDDPADLRVRREDGKLRFSHRTSAFVLARGAGC